MTADEIARVLVKGLVWEGSVQGCYLRAVTPYGIYEISVEYSDEWFCDFTSADERKIVRLSSTQDGPVVPQAAAEADYRARIAAALNLDLVAQLVEAASFLTWFKCKGSIGDALEAWEKLDTALAPFHEAP